MWHAKEEVILTKTMVADGEDSETGTDRFRRDGRGEAEDSLLLPPENSLTMNWTFTWLAPRVS